MSSRGVSFSTSLSFSSTNSSFLSLEQDAYPVCKGYLTHLLLYLDTGKDTSAVLKPTLELQDYALGRLRSTFCFFLLFSSFLLTRLTPLHIPSPHPFL
jgi:hypothetical protein